MDVVHRIRGGSFLSLRVAELTGLGEEEEYWAVRQSTAS